SCLRTKRPDRFWTQSREEDAKRLLPGTGRFLWLLNDLHPGSFARWVGEWPHRRDRAITTRVNLLSHRLRWQLLKRAHSPPFSRRGGCASIKKAPFLTRADGVVGKFQQKYGALRGYL